VWERRSSGVIALLRFMSAKSDYLENALVNLVLGGTAFAAPANVYLALFTTMPNDAGVGGVEVTIGVNGYARAARANDASTWGAATTNGTRTNSAAAFTFPSPGGSWGTVVGVGIYDAATAGNLLYYGLLSAPKTIASGQIYKFAAGSLSITEQ